MSTEIALELDTEAAGYTKLEPVHFGGFPGLWAPGIPVAVSELGFESEQAALDQVAELDLPLKQVNVDVGTAPALARPNHVLSEEQKRALDLDAEANWPPSNHAEADAAATAAGVVFPEGTRTVKEKVAFLEQARAGAITAEGEPTSDVPPVEA